MKTWITLFSFVFLLFSHQSFAEDSKNYMLNVDGTDYEINLDGSVLAKTKAGQR